MTSDRGPQFPRPGELLVPPLNLGGGKHHGDGGAVRIAHRQLGTGVQGENRADLDSAAIDAERNILARSITAVWSLQIFGSPQLPAQYWECTPYEGTGAFKFQ